MATDTTFQADAEKARSNGLRLATDPSCLQRRPPATTESGSESSSSHNSTNSFLKPAAARPFATVSVPIATGVTAVDHDAYTPAASNSTLDLLAKHRSVQMIAWLYDYTGGPEDDDWLHEPGVERKRSLAHLAFGWCNISVRGICNVGSLLLLSSCLLMLFAGYPVLYLFLSRNPDQKATSFFGLGGTNGSGQVPALPLFSLVDSDTPFDAYAWTNPLDRVGYHLVFSDEFETAGRTFWPGDDPFWEAMDLHYWVTGDFEWYSPEAVNTSNGFLNV